MFYRPFPVGDGGPSRASRILINQCSNWSNQTETPDTILRRPVGIVSPISTPPTASSGYSAGGA